MLRQKRVIFCVLTLVPDFFDMIVSPIKKHDVENTVRQEWGRTKFNLQIATNTPTQFLSLGISLTFHDLDVCYPVYEKARHVKQ